MQISNLPITDYTQTIPSPTPYRATKKNNLGGCYVIWAGAELKKMLLPLSVQMHCSISVFEQESPYQTRPAYSDSKLKLPLKQIIKAAANDSINGEKLFCLYVGKTANLAKRSPHSFNSFFSNLHNSDGGAAQIPFDRNSCYLSFVEIADWKERFYTENLLIAALKPVINLQPER
jgi:hypothetical protein